MQTLQQELWSTERERTHAHVGDLAWGTISVAGREREWKRLLWLDGDRCVAWAWLELPGSLDYEVHTDERGGTLHEEILDWFEQEADAAAPLHVFAMDGDSATLRLLRRRSFRRPQQWKSYAYHVSDLDRRVAVPSLPDGFTFRTVAGEDDLHARVQVHRAVWAPSRLTEENYRHLMGQWPYRPELDCVIEAPDGTFAAYVLCWYDDLNRVGEFEPVGTHPDYRRRGLGSAVCRFALQRLREEGAEHAVVYAAGWGVGAPARALYESVGFRRHTNMSEFCKER